MALWLLVQMASHFHTGHPTEIFHQARKKPTEPRNGLRLREKIVLRELEGLSYQDLDEFVRLFQEHSTEMNQ